MWAILALYIWQRRTFCSRELVNFVLIPSHSFPSIRFISNPMYFVPCHPVSQMYLSLIKVKTPLLNWKSHFRKKNFKGSKSGFISVSWCYFRLHPCSHVQVLHCSKLNCWEQLAFFLDTWTFKTQWKKDLASQRQTQYIYYYETQLTKAAISVFGLLRCYNKIPCIHQGT